MQDDINGVSHLAVAGHLDPKAAFSRIAGELRDAGQRSVPPGVSAAVSCRPSNLITLLGSIPPLEAGRKFHRAHGDPATPEGERSSIGPCRSTRSADRDAFAIRVPTIARQQVEADRHRAARSRVPRRCV
jgi:hypothetical protein